MAQASLDVQQQQPASKKRKVHESASVSSSSAAHTATNCKEEGMSDDCCGQDDQQKIQSKSTMSARKRRPNKEAIHVAAWIERNLVPKRSVEEETSANGVGIVLGEDGLPVEDEENPGESRGYPIEDVEKMCSLYAASSDVTNVSIKKPALLNLMTFLGKNRVTAHKIGNYEDVKIHTFDGVRRLQSIHRWKGENKIDADVYEQLQAKFGVQWFKISKFDLPRAQAAFKKIENLEKGKYGYVEVLLKSVKMKVLPPSAEFPQPSMFMNPRYDYIARIVTLEKKDEVIEEEDEDVADFLVGVGVDKP